MPLQEPSLGKKNRQWQQSHENENTQTEQCAHSNWNSVPNWGPGYSAITRCRLNSITVVSIL